MSVTKQPDCCWCICELYVSQIKQLMVIHGSYYKYIDFWLCDTSKYKLNLSMNTRDQISS